MWINLATYTVQYKFMDVCVCVMTGDTSTHSIVICANIEAHTRCLLIHTIQINTWVGSTKANGYRDEKQINPLRRHTSILTLLKPPTSNTEAEQLKR